MAVSLYALPVLTARTMLLFKNTEIRSKLIRDIRLFIEVRVFVWHLQSSPTSFLLSSLVLVFFNLLPLSLLISYTAQPQESAYISQYLSP